MVKYVILNCLLMFLFMLDLQAENTKIEVFVESPLQEGQNSTGMMHIIHPSQEEVDVSSFQLEGKILKVTFIKNENIDLSSQTMESIYQFPLPSNPKGLYILPAISVKIGNKTYTSTPLAYEVKAFDSPLSPSSQSSQPSKSLSKKNNGSHPLIFKLEANIKGPQILYPGQRTELFYRISYNRSVDLTESILPFIQTSSFKKIGDAHIRDFQNGDITVQEISQEIEANQIGNFELGPSSISGYSYQTNVFGKKSYQQPLLKADAPAVHIEVKPFPNQNKPTSFNGSLGAIHVTIQMSPTNQHQLGEKLLLEMKISGVENLEDFRLPDFRCQPGFSGFFQFSDLPLTGEVRGPSKYFQIELSPISSFVKQIPSFELSSFDPLISQYIIKNTDPLPLQLKTVPLLSSVASNTKNSSLDEEVLWNSSNWPLESLEIKNILTSTKINQNTHPFWIFLIIPFGVGWLSLQRYWKKLWDLKPKQIKKQSLFFLEKALKTKKNSQNEILNLLEKALWWKVWEEGLLPLKDVSLEKLASHGKSAKMKHFIYYLQSLQYSPHDKINILEIKTEAKKLLQYDS